ncbi:MAG: 3-methyl-2-oxobutanoate hydroxymethyltransferase [Epsilonproteobacteria bacterium]|nr:3-methyl-2-oxobutanoate hydroxymethyltransferase [Campylobacterota bacterium]
MSIHTKKRKININSIKKMKGNEKIVMVTAYDALFAKLFNDEVDMILVGDSLNMSFLGKPDTLSATMEQMLYHTKAVCNGATTPLIIFDMPFGSYNTKEEALKNAIKVYKESCADAIKIEGGADRAEIVRYLVQNGIAVISHIGLMPQFVRGEGGYRVRGKSLEDAQKLLEDAKILEEAGAFALLLEGIVSDVAANITKNVKIPTIGIGAGVGCDGQVLVWSDMFGFFEDFKPKFVKRYMEGASLIREALKEYKKEVKEGRFPTTDYSY